MIMYIVWKKKDILSIVIKRNVIQKQGEILEGKI